MEALEMIKGRRSVRTFAPSGVPHEVIEEIIDAARFSPSWKNTQIVRYQIIEDKKTQQEIAQNCVMGFSYNTKTIAQAPVLVVLSYITGRSGFERDGSYTTSKKEAWEMFDVGIVAQTFCLAAYEKGVGTCIMGIFEEQSVAQAIHLPPDQRVGALIAVGYPDQSPDAQPLPAPKRKEVKQLISYL